MKLDLTPGVCETEQYKAWIFPGGEIHLKLKEQWVSDIEPNVINIVTQLNTSQDIMFLLLVMDTLKKDYKGFPVNLFLPYMPYQQADRNFGEGECFSLKTITNLINSMGLNEVTVFDPHSDVCMALLDNSKVLDNSKFILEVLFQMRDEYITAGGYGEADLGILEKTGKFVDKRVTENLIILSPDAGAYKKIFKLCDKIGFTGQIECCSKSRDHITNELTIVVPKFDETKNVLIIDDICLGGRTFLKIKDQIENKTFLAISHGVFDYGVDHLLEKLTKIYTTDSRGVKHTNKNVFVYNLR